MTEMIVVGEYTISKLRSGEAVEFDNGVTVIPASDLATTDALRARVAKLEAALKEIGREQSAKTATVAADKFQSIARAALADAPQ